MSSQKTQTKTVTSTEAQNNFGELSRWVAKENRIVYIQNNRTKEKISMISEKHLTELENLRERERRREILKQLEALRANVQERIHAKVGRGLTDEEVEEMLKD